MVDLKRIGEFIAACRREKKLTQKQLGEKLNVTDRAADLLYSFYFRQEQYERAEQYLAYFSGHDPERKRKQAQIYRKTGRTQEAYQILEELLFSYFQLVSALAAWPVYAVCRGWRSGAGASAGEERKAAGEAF